ncbi:MAG: T9SS type A sorting domain-containing protein, partial [Phaeodactylibacter sp.]|nr:T9SS type A sorting domain-containing protein [Phaeodactylibacter sp.]
QEALPSLNGLDNLEAIGGDLYLEYNEQLADISSLLSLSRIGEGLYIEYNGALGSLNGLNNVDPNSLAFLSLLNSGELSDCAVESICYFLDNDGEAAISSNHTGCSSVEEVLSACAVLSAKAASGHEQNEVALFPNPTGGFLQVASSNPRPFLARILDSRGSLISSLILDANGQLDLSALPAGLYFIQLETGGQQVVKRVVKN